MNKLIPVNIFLSAIAALFIVGKTNAQDPNFSQILSSPTSISPALTGFGESSFRLMSNYRSQWIGLGSTYNTFAAAADGKINSINNNSYYTALGGSIIQDNAMDGIYKNTTATLNAAYHLTMDERGNGLTFGLGAIYNNTRIDFSQLTFDTQLSSAGFNRALPTGEVSLKNMKGYFSLCAGLMFTHTSDETYYAIGVAGYRFTKTQRTVLDDASQYDAPRYSIHADYATALSDRLNFNASIFHMIKAGTSTTIAGGIFGFINNSTVYADGPLSIFNLGAFYRLGNAVIPYVGFEYHNLSIGLTYDVDVSTATAGSAVAKSFELSLVWRKFAEDAKPAAGKYHSPF